MKMIERHRDAYHDALFDTDYDAAIQAVHRALADGVTPEDVVLKIAAPALLATMDSLGEDLDENLARHYLTAQITVKVTDEMIPQFTSKVASSGCVVIGTVAGDLHSLGKMIVGGCLKSFMVNVVDLGVNVSKERFVEAAIEKNAKVIAMSSMMVHTARGPDGCLGVRKLLEEKGLCGKIRLIVGGAPFRFDPELYKKVGADAWASDGMHAAQEINKIIKETNQ